LQKGDSQGAQCSVTPVTHTLTSGAQGSVTPVTHTLTSGAQRSVTAVTHTLTSTQTKPTVPNFAQNEKSNREKTKKRRVDEQDNEIKQSAVEVLKEVAGHMRHRTEKSTKTEKKRTDNEKYCLYLASQLDGLSSINQIKTRKKIDDIVFQAAMEEAEKN
jgi:hypothetical protein